MRSEQFGTEQASVGIVGGTTLRAPENSGAAADRTSTRGSTTTMTRTPRLRRRPGRGPVGLALLAAAGIGVGVARYIVARPSGPAPSDARPKPAPQSSPSDSQESESVRPGGADSEAAAVSDSKDDADSDGKAEAQPIQQGVRTERLFLEEEWGSGPLDGTWWPDSPDAAQAVPGLVEALPGELRVSRLALPMPDWSDDQPKTVRLDDDRTIHLAWFAGMQRHTARITFETGDAVTVLVLPSDTEAEAASNVLSRAGEQLSREDLLAEAGVDD
jgi:hypothetical protein